MSDTPQIDKFEQHRLEMFKQLQQCQQQNNYQTCSSCEKYLDCTIRDGYVDAVYSSMSKGDTGGFEF